MDCIPADKYLRFNTNTLEEVRREVNLHRAGEMKEAVRILQEWIQQQPHFKKKDFLPHYLEMILLTSKGSLERAKSSVDAACTIRTLMPKYFEPYDPKKGIPNVWDKNYLLVLPKLYPDNCRCALYKFVGKYHTSVNMDRLYNYTFMIADYLLTRDYCSSVIIIFDVTELDLVDTFSKLNLFEVKDCFQVMLDCYSLRLRRLHIITNKTFVEKIIAFFRPFIKKKLMERVMLNKSAEELYRYYPIDVLPKDYGGSGKSISELHDECLQRMCSDEHLEYKRNIFKAQVDESLRPQGQFNELYAGTVGSFRTLTVD